MYDRVATFQHNYDLGLCEIFLVTRIAKTSVLVNISSEKGAGINFETLKGDNTDSQSKLLSCSLSHETTQFRTSSCLFQSELNPLSQIKERFHLSPNYSLLQHH